MVSTARVQPQPTTLAGPHGAVSARGMYLNQTSFEPRHIAATDRPACVDADESD
jgi:hypothetical protein